MPNSCKIVGGAFALIKGMQLKSLQSSSLRRRRMFFFLFACTALSLQGAANASLSIIFDTSASICGFMQSGEDNRAIKALVRQAMIERNPDAGISVWTLRKRRGVDEDMVLATPDLTARVDNLSRQSATDIKSCAPFDGVDSNLDRIFSHVNFANEGAVVLITDAQMTEADRDRFLNGFDKWAGASVAKGKIPYAGFIVSQLGFSGRYFAVAEPEEKLRASGYKLPHHQRPLVLLWFAQGDNELSVISRLVATFSGTETRVQHLLPVARSGQFPLRIDNFPSTASLQQLFKDGGTISKVTKYDSSRSDVVVKSCVRPQFVGNSKVVLHVLRHCADDNPLWYGVSKLSYELQLKSPYPGAVINLTGMQPGAAKGSYDFDIDHSVKEEHVSVSLSLPNSSNRVDLADWSLDSDYCQNAARSLEGCTKMLNRKTFQLDQLSQQLVDRAAVQFNAIAGKFGKMDFDVIVDQ